MGENMQKNILKYHNIYLFIIVLAFIGFLCGFFYYKVQSAEVKDNIKTTIAIEEDLGQGSNNIFKSIKKSFFVLGAGLLVLTQISNLIKIFYEPFEIGFIFSFLLHYNLKMAFIYTLLYHLIPLFFLFILIRISITISIDLIRLILVRSKKDFKHFKLILIKYLIIAGFLFFYEFIIALFSAQVNAYLLTLI